MNLRCVIALLVLLASLASTKLLPAANRTGLSRDEIKSMPITERPQRIGHFYGRTVRWVNGVKGGQGVPGGQMVERMEMFVGQ